MKRIFALSLLLLTCFEGQCEELYADYDWQAQNYLDGIPRLNPAGLVVEFAVTNPSLTVVLARYRAKPLRLTSSALTNLLTELNFRPSDRSPQDEGVHPLAEAHYSRSLPRSAALRILPRQGVVQMTGQSPKWDRTTNCTVPSALEVMSRASNLLFSVLGAAPDELAQQSHGLALINCNEGTVSTLDRKTRKEIKRVSQRTVSIKRALDNNQIFAGGNQSFDALRLVVVDDGEIVGFDLCWPPVEKIQSVAPPTLGELHAAVRLGQARTLARGLKHFVVERVDYYYEKRGNPPAVAIYHPLVYLLGQGDNGRTNFPAAIIIEWPPGK